MLRTAAVLACLAAPAWAGVDEAIRDHVLPATAGFAEATAGLAETAAADCRPEAVRPAFQDAFDAWRCSGRAMRPSRLLNLHRRGEGVRLASADLAEQVAMKGYAGSVSFDGAGRSVGITSPRGGRLHRFSPDGVFLGAERRADICGLAPMPGGYLASDGLGALVRVDAGGLTPLAASDRAWDNHLIAVDAV